MHADAVWRAFAETGEPVFYLLYRAMNAERTRKEEARVTAG